MSLSLARQGHPTLRGPGLRARRATQVALCVVFMSSCGPATTVECASAPVVTYDTFGDGFLRANCQGCHASGAADRKGAPESVVFDDEADAAAQKDRILARVQEGTMPPAGGLVPDDVERLEIWLTCHAP